MLSVLLVCSSFLADPWSFQAPARHALFPSSLLRKKFLAVLNSSPIIPIRFMKVRSANFSFSVCWGFGLAYLTSCASSQSAMLNWIIAFSWPAWMPPCFPSRGFSNCQSLNSIVPCPWKKLCRFRTQYLSCCNAVPVRRERGFRCTSNPQGPPSFSGSSCASGSGNPR